MAFADIFNRKRKPLDEAEGEGISPVGGELAGNEAVRRKQRMLLAGVAGVGLVLSSMWIFSGDDDKKLADADGAEKVEVSTKDMVNRNLSNQEWMALSENRFQSTENQLKSVNGQSARMDNLAAQIEALKGQNQAMQADGQRVLSAYQAENEQLRKQINDRPAAPPPAPGPAAMYGPRGPQAYQRPDAAGGAGAVPVGHSAEVKMVNFSTGESGPASKVAKGSTLR